jgi:hypothetical protein
MPKPYLSIILPFAAWGLAGCLSSDSPAPLEISQSPGESPSPEALPPDNVVATIPVGDTLAAIPPEDTLAAATWASLLGCWVYQENGNLGYRTRTLQLSGDGAFTYSGSHPKGQGICRSSTLTRSLWGSMTMERDSLLLQSDFHLGTHYSSGGGGKNCGRINLSDTLTPVSAAFSFTLVDDTLRLNARSSWPGYHYEDPSELPVTRSFTRCTFWSL